VLDGIICIDDKRAVLDEAARVVATMPLKHRKFVVGDMWDYLRDAYPREQSVADVAFLDFYGGGLRKEDPFKEEIAGLRNYFARHANFPNRAFVLAWTYMPRDRGKAFYVDACQKLFPPQEMDLLRRSTGMWSRSVAIRLLLKHSLVEHEMLAKVFHHAVYKCTMNALILLFSKGADPKCKLPLGDPSALLKEPVVVYETGKTVPVLVPFPT
jgi:hypothetical protein